MNADVFQSTPQRVECAWCGVTMREGREPVSHGICVLCFHGQLLDAGLSAEAADEQTRETFPNWEGSAHVI